MTTVMVVTLTYGYMSGDIAHGRLNSIAVPVTFQWYHLAAPTLLLGLTRLGVPVSTTILTLSVFSSTVVLEKDTVKVCSWICASSCERICAVEHII